MNHPAGARAFLACLLLCAAAGVQAFGAGKAGVMLVRTGSVPSPLEIACLDALILQIPRATGLSAALLHDASPLVLGRGVELPAVAASGDWSALGPALSRLAAQLQLDYVLAAAIVPGDNGTHLQAVVAVRGGGARQFAFDQPELDLATAARSVADGLRQAIAEDLPAPRDPGDEQVPLPTPPAPTADTPGPTPTAPEPPTPTEPVVEPAPTEKPVPTGGLGPLEPAAAAFNRGQYKEALALVNQVINTGGATAQAYLLRARCQLALNELEAAMGDLRRAIDADPELIEAHVRLARLLSERGLWQVAADRYLAALQIKPDDREALLGLARLYRDNGHRQRAIDLLEGVPSAADDAGVVLMLAELYALNGDDLRAQATFLRAVALSEGDTKAVALERLGDFYVSIRRHRDALSCYLQAAELSPARGAVARRRYEEVMRAADKTVCDELTASWAEFAAWARDGQGERELVFTRMAAARAHVDEAMRFADSLMAPEELRAQHAQRQFAYSLAFEATVTALSYVDLGGASMRDRAFERYQEALAEFERLREAP